MAKNAAQIKKMAEKQGPDNLEQRVLALEAQVQRLLAAVSKDRDV